MTNKSQLRNARRRLDRFVAEYGDELLRLKKERQAELLEDVHQGRASMARAKLRMYAKEARDKRASASRKAGETRFRERQLAISARIARVMPNASRTRVMRNSHLLIRDDVNRLYNASEPDFEFYVKNAAREASVTGIVASPFFYK